MKWLEVLCSLLVTIQVCVSLPSVLKCPEANYTCSFELTIAAKLVMILGSDQIAPCDGNLCYASGENNGTRVPADKLDEISQADGVYKNTKRLIVVNGEMPGPTIDAYENTTLIIKVKNRLLSDSTTIHWHGLIQQDTNLMDGVAFVNQCPILPGLDFTYKFHLINPGSDFYHAHTGAQRTMGLFGSMITRSRTKSTPAARDDPVVSKDYPMALNDWNHNYDAKVARLKESAPYDDGVKFIQYKAPDGTGYPAFKWHSGLIAGKGRYYDPDTGTHNNAPLTVYNITRNAKVRFRAVGTGTLFPLRVSIDNHPLTMISSDGYRFEDTPVQSFIISPGERFDFIVEGNKPSGCYWIRVETLEVGVNHSAEAILQYEDNPLTNNNYDDYATNTCFQPWLDGQETCKDSIQPCKVLNCPYERYAESENIECAQLQDMTTLETDDSVDHDGDFVEAFFNYAFVANHLSINGRHFVLPQVPATPQSNELLDDFCTDPTCNTTGCTCTNFMNLERDKQYQFVYTSVGSGIGPAHPIHLHGHGFQVVYQGFAPLNVTTGLSDDNFTNNHINCSGGLQPSHPCNSPRWASGLYPTLKARFNNRPAKKDTITIPAGGYAVVRFKANNPGWWYTHCHIELHNLGGMAMMLSEAPGSREYLFGKIPSPQSFPRCRNYPTDLPPTDPPSTNPPSTDGVTAGGTTCYAGSFSVLLSVSLAFLISNY